MMLMLNEYKCVAKQTQDPSDISGDYKYIKANMNVFVKILQEGKENEYKLYVKNSGQIALLGQCTLLGQGVLHKSPLLGDYIEFEIGVVL